MADSRACDEVRAGIIAFNLGEYDETVRRFERAVPLAVQQMDGTRASRQLIAAVRYYADLAPDDYPAAAQGSEEFATYKAITLGQCGDGLDQVPTSPTESPQFEA